MKTFMQSFNSILWWLCIAWSIMITSGAKLVDPNSTVIVGTRVNAEDMIYPPLKVCYSHWIAWVNFTVVREMNFTKPEVYYAMSYLTQKIYSSERFDVKATEESFFQKLKFAQLTMTNFFLKIARQFDSMLFGTTLPIAHETTLERLISLYNQYYVLCYTFSGATVARLAQSRRKQIENGAEYYMSQAEEHAVKLNLHMFQPIQGQVEVKEEEMEQYMKYTYDILGGNFRIPSRPDDFPAFLYVNGYDQEYPQVVSMYTPIRSIVKASAFVWRNHSGRQCVMNRPYIVNDDSCYRKCMSPINMDEYHCGATKYGFPPDGGFFYFPGDDGKFKEPAERHAMCFPETITLYQYHQNGDYSCVKKCRSEIGCVTWSFDLNTERVPFNGPTTIQYPIPEHTFIMKEA